MPSWTVSFDTRISTNSQEIIECLAKIRALAKVIHGIPIPPSVQERLDHLNILRAVRGTTGIEGVELTEEEVGLIMEASPNKPVLPQSRRREEQEVRNSEMLMYFVAEQINKDKTMPVTEELICKIHEITTRDIDYSHNIPGKYRSHPVVAGDYTPPRDGENVIRLMKEFVVWFNTGSPSKWDPIINAIVAHFYIVTIHPFGDGNGRTARGLESFLLYKAGVNARGFYSLANYYYRQRNEYIANLDYVRFKTNGDLTPFVFFALKGLVEELEAVHNEVLEQVKIISFRDYAREVLSVNGKLGTKSGERMFHFLLQFEDKSVSLKSIRSGKSVLSSFYRKVTSRTLTRDINFLKQNKLIITDGDKLQPNLDVMTQFTPPSELRRKTQTSTPIRGKKKA